MPKIKVNNLTMNYEQQGGGEPLLHFVCERVGASARGRCGRHIPAPARPRSFTSRAS